MKKVGIVGAGHVGKAMKELFVDAILYDKYLKIGSKEEINRCEVVFICVPTPMNADGSCNTLEVEEVLVWIESEILVLRSTVPIGFTDKMKKKYEKRIVFQPEYYGETQAHPFASLKERKWLSFGGDANDIHEVICAYHGVMTSDVKINIYPAKEVEMAKYMENAYLAMKVIFCNEIYDIAEKMEVNYDIAREVWLSDPRIGSSHTFVYENNRGYGGSCLPKDIAALRKQGMDFGADVTLLDAIIQKNQILRSENESIETMEKL